MKVYVYININLLDVLNKMISNPLHHHDAIEIYSSTDSGEHIMIQLDYDTLILLQDQNLIKLKK